MTGWGQEAPLGMSAGHDIDYIAIAGVLWPIGRGGESPFRRSISWGTSVVAE